MKLPLLILSFFLTVAISGCAPNAVTYYLPTTDGGVVSTRNCVPTNSLLDFEIKNTQSSVKVRAWAKHGNPANLVYLAFSGDSWSSIKFNSVEFVVNDLEKNTTLRPLKVYASHNKNYGPLHTTTYIVPPWLPAQRIANLPRFSLDIILAEPMPGHFELVSPSIVIDGKDIKFPSIHFEKKTWVGLSPLNC